MISDEQSKAIKLLETNNIYIDAVAGSGKTTTNIHIAQKYESKDILLLTYNARLKLETRQRVFDLSIDNLEVHTYHSFCVKYYDDKTFTDEKMINICDTNMKGKEFSYDLIIADESQDITMLYYKLIHKIIRDNEEKDCKI